MRPADPQNIIIIVEDKGEFNYSIKVLDSKENELQRIKINEKFNFGISLTEGLFKWIKSDELGIKCYAL